MIKLPESRFELYDVVATTGEIEKGRYVEGLVVGVSPFIAKDGRKRYFQTWLLHLDNLPTFVLPEYLYRKIDTNPLCGVCDRRTFRGGYITKDGDRCCRACFMASQFVESKEQVVELSLSYPEGFGFSAEIARMGSADIRGSHIWPRV